MMGGGPLPRLPLPPPGRKWTTEAGISTGDDNTIEVIRVTVWTPDGLKPEKRVRLYRHQTDINYAPHEVFETLHQMVSQVVKEHWDQLHPWWPKTH
jgi:hypothetical protein